MSSLTARALARQLHRHAPTHTVRLQTLWLPRIATRPCWAPRTFASARLLRQDVPGTPTILDDHAYGRMANSSLNLILLRLEAAQDTSPPADGEFDIEYSDGVMNVALPNDGGTYVINRQPFSKQIWLSSPTSGPKRFDYYTGTGWVYKDGTRLRELLQEEWQEAGLKVDLEGLGIRDDVELE